MPAHSGSGLLRAERDVVVTGLSAGGTYHYRFVASNKVGSTNGADHTFASFAIQSFTFETLDAEGHPYTQAGGHPYVLRTSFALSRNGIEAQANVKDVETQLPPGLIGDPTALATCTRSQLTAFQCPGAAQVGLITLQTTHGGAFFEEPLYNLLPPAGVPAEFGTRFTRSRTSTSTRTFARAGTTGDGAGQECLAATGVVGATVDCGVCPPRPATTRSASVRHPPVRWVRSAARVYSRHGARAVLAGADVLWWWRLSVNMSVDSWQDAGAFVSRTARCRRRRAARLRASRRRCHSARPPSQPTRLRPRSEPNGAPRTGVEGARGGGSAEQQHRAARRCRGLSLGGGGAAGVLTS